MWTVSDNRLYRRFVFNDFNEAFRFMTEVAKIAEAQNHHPNWTNVYNVVEIYLNTHDAGDVITEKDYKLASAIDKLLSE